MNKTQARCSFFIMILMIFIISTANISAQTTEKKVVISGITTEIEGSTKRRYLLDKINLYEGKEFTDYSELVAYMENATQDLINMRVFENVDYLIEEDFDSDLSAESYKLAILIKDANNTFFVPLAGYGSSNGFKVALKSNFYNIFGSLINFRVSSSLNFNENEALGRWDIPTWNITPSITGINLLGLDFSLSLTQKFDTIKKPAFDGTIQYHYTYHSTSLALKSAVDLSHDFTYTFGPSIRFKYGLKKIVDSTEAILPDFANLTWSHKIGYSKINWIENLRDGFAANISNSLTASYDIDRTASFSTTIGAGLTYLWRINKVFNLSGRLNGSWSNKEIDLGGYIRGVRSGSLKGDLGAAMNIDMTISAINLDGLFEFQARPFFDIGIVENLSEPFSSFDDLAYTAGLDGILYIDRWKSFLLRGTFGIDLSHFEWDEFKKYEIEMTASLSY